MPTFPTRRFANMINISNKHLVACALFSITACGGPARRPMDLSKLPMYKAEPDITGEKGYTFDPNLAEYVGKSLAGAADKA